MEGRNPFQKLSYLVNIPGWNSFDDYRFHYYGPFSDSLTNYIEGMQQLGWLQKSPVETGKGNTIYKYSSAEGNVTKALASRIEDPRFISRSEGLLSPLGKFNSDELEIMASLVFLYQNEKLEGEELIKRIKELEPKFSESEIRDSAKTWLTNCSWRRRYRTPSCE